MYKWKPKIPHHLFFKNAEKVIAVSDTIKYEYENRSSIEINLIPPLLPFNKSNISKDVLLKDNGFDSNNLIILSLGSIKKIKGSDVLLEAFFDLGEDYIKANNLRLIFVGDGVLRSILEKRTVKKGYDNYVKFFGKIPYKKVSDMYKIADVYVIPSKFEGMPISLLEAMFNGLPCIGSDVDGINNLIVHRKNGLLFSKQNVSDLTECLKMIFDNKDFAQSLGDCAKLDYSKGYKFENMLYDHIKLYQSIFKRVK